MVLSILETLSASARLAFPYIQGMVEAGLSSSRIQEALSVAGMGVRRTDLLEAIRAVNGVEISRDYLSSLRSTFLPDPSRLGTPATQTLRDFSFHVVVHGTDGTTGETILKHVTISSSSNLSKSALEDLAIGITNSGEGRYANFTAAGATVKTGTYLGNL